MEVFCGLDDLLVCNHLPAFVHLQHCVLRAETAGVVFAYPASYVARASCSRQAETMHYHADVASYVACGLRAAEAGAGVWWLLLFST